MDGWVDRIPGEIPMQHLTITSPENYRYVVSTVVDLL
jgi:hypothetical protein